MAAANKLRPIVLSRFVLNVICPLVGWFSLPQPDQLSQKVFLCQRKEWTCTDSSTPKFKNAAKKKKKKLGGRINCDLYFSPTGIKNVLISSKIEKKKKEKKKTSGDYRIQGLSLRLLQRKKRKEKKTLDRITEVFHFQYLRDFGIKINTETKPK